jgi:hypothetical protein
MCHSSSAKPRFTMSSRFQGTWMQRLDEAGDQEPSARATPSKRVPSEPTRAVRRRSLVASLYSATSAALHSATSAEDDADEGPITAPAMAADVAVIGDVTLQLIEAKVRSLRGGGRACCSNPSSACSIAAYNSYAAYGPNRVPLVTTDRVLPCARASPSGPVPSLFDRFGFRRSARAVNSIASCRVCCMLHVVSLLGH